MVLISKKYPVILYQMGKVGSSTLEYSLKSISFPTLHIHRYFFDSYETKDSLFHYYLKRIKDRILFNYYFKNRNVRVISLYRDPLSRNISSFFQNIDRYFSREELKNLNFKLLKSRFDQLHNIHKTPDDWFSTEFLRKTGVNIFDYPFDNDKGYITIKRNGVRYFICTLEVLDTLEMKIAEFIDYDKFKLLKKNVGSTKWYSSFYDDFKNRYIPSNNMLDRLYNSKTTRYFYSQEQISEFRKRWE